MTVRASCAEPPGLWPKFPMASLERECKKDFSRPPIRERRDRGFPSFDRHPRRREAAFEAGTHVHDLFVEVARDVAHPADIGLVFRDAAPIRRAARAIPRMNRAGKRRFIVAKSLLCDECLEHGAKDRGVDSFRRNLPVGMASSAANAWLQ